MKAEEPLSKEAVYSVCDKSYLFIRCFYSCSLTLLVWPWPFTLFKRQFDYLHLFLSRGTSVKFMKNKLIQWLEPFGSLNQIYSCKLCMKKTGSSRLMKKMNIFCHNTSNTDIFPMHLSVGKLHKILLFVSLIKPANK